MSLASLREVRAQLGHGRRWGLVGAIASVYALLSMLIGQMLYFEPIGGDFVSEIVWNGNGTHWWDYPGVLVVQSWGILELPFFPTLAMVLVSVGVGIGATVGLLVVGPLLGTVARAARRSGATGAAAGVGPAITGLATLGACCCTSCAGAAGIGVIAAASGTNLDQLLLNDWYIGLFQVAVVYLALVALERSLRLSAPGCPLPPPIDRRYLAGAVLRLALLIAGITWSLAMFVEWGTQAPLTASAATWFHWVFEHQLLSAIAVAAGMFPREFADALRRAARRTTGRVFRAAAGLAAVTWGLWVPPSLVAAGLGGLLNEVLGALGAPASWGAVAPDSPLGAALAFHWVLQHLLLAGFAFALAVWPDAATTPLRWTVPVGPSTASASPARADAPGPAPQAGSGGG